MAQRRSAARPSAEHGAGRKLVGGCHQDRADVGLAEAIDAKPILIDRDRHRAKARRADDRALLGVARVLDGHAAEPALAQRLTDDPKPLREAGAQDHQLRAGHRAPRAVQVGRQRRAHRLGAAGVRVPQHRIGRGGQGTSQRGEPCPPREHREVGHARAKVVAKRRRPALGSCARNGAGRPGGDACRRAPRAISTPGRSC